MRVSYLPLLVLYATLLAGCSDPAGPDTATVTGVVLMTNDEPVSEAVVVFTPKETTADTQLAAQAETDNNGVFRMETHVGGEDYKDGIPPGEYLVTVTKLEVVQDMRTKPKHLLPKKYRLPKTTDLAATVVAGESNEFEFKLSR